jgi:hypothetical protein
MSLIDTYIFIKKIKHIKKATMSNALIIELPENPDTLIKSLTQIIAVKGFTIKSVDRENGIINFETGKSMRSYAGQDMTIVITEKEEKISTLIFSGVMKSHGDQIQVHDWGEAKKIANQLIEELAKAFGKPNFIQGSEDSGSCYIATSAYGTYHHPDVLKLRAFRDSTLRKSKLGLWFIAMYYEHGEKIARFVRPSNNLGKITRRVIKVFLNMTQR